HNVPVPPTTFISGPDEPFDSVPDLAHLVFPIVIKVDNRRGRDGRYLKGTVRTVEMPEKAREVLESLRGVRAGIIAQQAIPGSGYGATFLRWNGRYVLSFGHRRLHEVPWTGGFSSLRESYDHPRMFE